MRIRCHRSQLRSHRLNTSHSPNTSCWASKPRQSNWSTTHQKERTEKIDWFKTHFRVSSVLLRTSPNIHKEDPTRKTTPRLTCLNGQFRANSTNSTCKRISNSKKWWRMKNITCRRISNPTSQTFPQFTCLPWTKNRRSPRLPTNRSRARTQNKKRKKTKTRRSRKRLKVSRRSIFTKMLKMFLVTCHRPSWRRKRWTWRRATSLTALISPSTTNSTFDNPRGNRTRHSATFKLSDRLGVPSPAQSTRWPSTKWSRRRSCRNVWPIGRANPFSKRTQKGKISSSKGCTLIPIRKRKADMICMYEASRTSSENAPLCPTTKKFWTGRKLPKASRCSRPLITQSWSRQKFPVFSRASTSKWLTEDPTPSADPVILSQPWFSIRQFQRDRLRLVAPRRTLNLWAMHHETISIKIHKRI